MKNITIQYYISNVSSWFLSFVSFAVWACLVLLALFVGIDLAGIDEEWIQRNDFFTKILITLISSLLAYISFKIQKNRSKKESETYEYYEKIVVPLYRQLQTDIKDIEIVKYDEMIDKAINTITDIDFDFYIPSYLAKALSAYNDDLKTLSRLKKEVNVVFYEKAFTPRFGEHFAISGNTGTDYLKNYMKDPQMVFIYCANGETFSREKQEELNAIALEEILKDKKYKDINALNNKVKEKQTHIINYLRHFIKKARKKLI